MAQGLLKVSEAVSSVSPTETETFLVVHVHSLIPLCFVLVFPPRNKEQRKCVICVRVGGSPRPHL